MIAVSSGLKALVATKPIDFRKGMEGLARFLEDGRIEIDSDSVERAIRPIVLNSKNALLAGSDGGDEHWDIFASLIVTAKLNGIDPQANLADILARIANGQSINRLSELRARPAPRTADLKGLRNDGLTAGSTVP